MNHYNFVVLFNIIKIYVINFNFSDSVYDTLNKCGLYDDQSLACFPTIHDAVIFVENNRLQPPQNTRL